jgi:hypothetical protein
MALVISTSHNASGQGLSADAGPVVYCRDSVRGIVTRSLSRDCPPDSVISEKEAQAIRNESAERRRRLMFGERPEPVSAAPAVPAHIEPAPDVPPAPSPAAEPPKPPIRQSPLAEKAPDVDRRPEGAAPPRREDPASAPPPAAAAEAAAPPAAPAPRTIPSPRPLTGDLARMIAAMPEGWTQLSDKISRVFPERGSTEWGSVGPSSVLVAWNNIAFDGERYLYAHGGGHADYGGNEIYRYDIVEKKWERLTDPAPYPARVMTNPDGSPTARNSPERCPHAESGPPSTHTYDGKIWSAALKRLLVFTNGIAFCPSGVGERGGDSHVWAFDPVTKTWEDLGPSPRGGLPWTVELPNGNIALGSSKGEVIWDPVTRTKVAERIGYPDEGDGSAIYDARKNRIVVSNRFRIATIPLTADYRFAGARTSIPVSKDHLGGIPFDRSSAIDAFGRLIRWGGAKHVVSVDLDTGARQAYTFETGPNGSGPLYDRMFPVLGHPDVFVAISNNANEGVWLFRMPAGPGAQIATQSLQQQFDGGARKFQPGVYGAGLLITKGARVDLTGVRPMGATEGKAAVVVRTTEPVVIENLTVSGLRGGGNVAGVKAEGAGFNVTIRNAHISDCEMGILTDNKGGRLVIESSIIEKNGRMNGDKGHGIYAGEIDELIVRNSRVLESRNFGHLIKSRAHKSVIEGNIVAQLDANGSRIIDFSAGGENVVRNNIFQQGPNTDNAEMIGFGLETVNRMWAEQSSLVEGNTFISDVTKRPSSSIISPFKARTEPKSDPTGFVASAHQVTARNNRFVSPNGSDLKLNPAIYAPTLVHSGNKEFVGREAAGLPAYPALPK